MGKTNKKRRRYGNRTKNYFNQNENGADEVIDEKEILDEFSKAFAYDRNAVPSESWLLPPTDKFFSTEIWKNDDLCAMKKELNKVKDLLSDKDIEVWHNHTKSNHGAGKTVSYLRHSIQPEICTQAWCKFYEIVSRFSIVPSHEAQFNSVHLCEAPGAFISALNHYLKSHRPYIEWQWIGNTLNPYYEGNGLRYMINDDIFIKNTLDCWYFGTDNTGDITSVANILNLKKQIENPVQLVTADGSFNCQNNPAEQEKLVSPLHFCELLASFSLLAHGGSLVVKMFTFFEAESVCQMYLLNCVFGRVHVFKPATSKPGNSEVYVVCLDYQGIADDIMQKLLRSVGQTYEEKILFPLSSIPESFLKQHKSCCQYFMDCQVKTIRYNIETFDSHSHGEFRQVENLRDRYVQHFVQRYLVKSISNHDRIIPRRSEKNKRGQLRFAHERLQGTYNYRKHVISSSWQHRVNNMSYKEEDDQIYIIENDYETITTSEIVSWKIVCGKPIGQILSSKFCSQALLDDYNELMENSQGLKSFNMTDDSGIQKKVCESIVSTVFTEQVRWNITDISKRTSHLSGNLFTALDSKMCSYSETDVTSIIYVADVTVDNQNCEISCHEEFLSSLVKVLTTLESGGYFVIKICSTYTRFSVGLIWLLSKCFHQVYMDKFGEPADNEYQYLVCVKFIGQSENIAEYTQLTVQRMREISKVNEAVLQFIPMMNLLDAEFLEVIQRVNNKSLVKYINQLIHLNKSTIDL